MPDINELRPILIFAAALFALLRVPSVDAVDVQVRIVADEAEAALAILSERREAGSVRPESWERLWKSEGFTRLKKRQESFGATEVEKGFQEYLMSDEALARLDALRESVMSLKRLDATAPARRAAVYLPAGTRLRATVYPVIKKSTNTFVFDLPENPAVFLYVDPDRGAADLENTMAHELHHVGMASCPEPPGHEKLSPPKQRALRYLGAFSEGVATLAAAGGPDVHPHATSAPEAWLIWERDVAGFNSDLPRLESFFREVLAGDLSEEEERRRLFSFINTDEVPQGAFYTVGWKIAAVVERARGREALVKTLCDPRALLAAYNEVAASHSRRDGGGLARWSPDFLAAFQPAAAIPSPGL